MKNLSVHLKLHQYNSEDASFRQVPGFENVAYMACILSAETGDQTHTLPLWQKMLFQDMSISSNELYKHQFLWYNYPWSHAMILWKKSGNIEREIRDLDICRLLLTAMWTAALIITVLRIIILYNSGLSTITEKYYWEYQRIILKNLIWKNTVVGRKYTCQVEKASPTELSVRMC